jgi:hypothetical protein
VTAEAILAGIGTILGLVVVAGMRGDWVWGWVYRSREKALMAQLLAAERREIYWRNIALKAMGHTDRALDIAEKATPDPDA